MGHTIQHYDYPGNADKKKVEQELANYVAKRCFQEGGHLSKIRCIANAMSDDLRDSLKDNGAARMRDDIHILYGQNTDVDGHEIFVFVPFNPDSDICAKAVRIIEKYLNVNACGKNMMRCIRALVEAADINSLINN